MYIKLGNIKQNQLKNKKLKYEIFLQRNAKFSL